MSEGRTAAFLVVVVCLWTPLRGADRSVLCRLTSSCLLPCPFDKGPEVVIHWLHPPDSSSPVHSFYHDKDQLGRQLPQYKGRTKLFPDQISRGNASLLLTRVQLQDRGRYKCYTSTMDGNNELFINLEVEALSDVHLEEDGSVLKCSSSDVFPEPSVSWTPPSDVTPSVSSLESGLFSVLNSVTLPQTPPYEYICNISTKHSWRSATYRRNEGVTWSGPGTVLPCMETESSMKSLVWTFNRTQNILKKTGSDPVFSRDWESRANLCEGSKLVLKDLTRDQQGVYSCEVITDQRSYLTVTEVTVDKTPTGASAVKAGVIAAIVAALIALIVLGVWWCRKHRKAPKHRTHNVEYAMARNGPD